jgi:hypothetical protein
MTRDTQRGKFPRADHSPATKKNVVNKNLCILSQVYYNITFLTKIPISNILYFNTTLIQRTVRKCSK